MRVCMGVCVYVCVSVCVLVVGGECLHEREKESSNCSSCFSSKLKMYFVQECVCVCLCVHPWLRDRICDSVCVSACTPKREKEREGKCVCVYVLELAIRPNKELGIQ